MLEIETTARAPSAARWQRAVNAFTVLMLAYALFRAISLAWVCDDAFISFRYADHLARGHGLVWNPGERVEGITNLLWTLLFVPALAAGIDPVVLSEWLGIVCYLVVLAAVWLLEVRTESPQQLRIPVACWVLCALEDLHVWATGGLETMFVTALVTAVAALLYWGGDSRRRQLLAGVVAGLAFLARPDAILIVGALGAVAALRRWPDRQALLSTLLRFSGPLVLIVAATTVFRITYFGDYVPNTFYAKSAGTAWWTQGLRFLAVFFGRNYALGALLLCALCWAALSRRAERPRPEIWLRLALWSSTALFVVYVVRSGGDYMQTRRLVPVVPLFVMACTLELSSWGTPGIRWVAATLVTLFAALAVPIVATFGQEGRLWGIADERTYYPKKVIDFRRKQGEALAAVFEGTRAGFVIEGGLCVLAYYSHLPHIVEINGLTDKTIARQEISTRGLHGHEKNPTNEYLDQRDVQYVVLHSIPPRRRKFNIIELSHANLYLHARYYDPAVVEKLRSHAGVKALNARELVRIAQREVTSGDCMRASATFAVMDSYLFQRNPEFAEDRARLAATVRSRCPAAP